jgi:hypothetical protein
MKLEITETKEDTRMSGQIIEVVTPSGFKCTNIIVMGDDITWVFTRRPAVPTTVRRITGKRKRENQINE